MVPDDTLSLQILGGPLPYENLPLMSEADATVALQPGVDQVVGWRLVAWLFGCSDSGCLVRWYVAGILGWLFCRFVSVGVG